MQGESPVIVVLSGTNDLKLITSSDPQIDRRFTKVIPRPFAGREREGGRRAGGTLRR
jgi:hypothetical protein